MSVSITRIVKFIRKGKGVIVAQSRNVYNYTYKEWTQFYGLSGRSVNWDGIINVSDFSVGDTMVINGTVSDKQRITISLYAKVTAIDTNRAIITAQSLYYIASGENGDKGDRGPALRGPQAWSDCAVGYVFQSGANGEEYKDIVLYGNNYYSCIKSHTKTASNNPGSATDTNSGLWKLADKLEIVATKILLAQYALVKNLGVETIDMKDDKGNIIFQAKDGNVICNSGTFNNIKVTGDSEFSGTMKAVSGSFKSLNCVDDNGKVLGNITFGNDGRMWFDGDMYSQGYNYDEKRGYRFYANNVFCRGLFGHREKTMAVVKGTYMYVYSKGTDQPGKYVSLKTGTTSNNKTFYYIPLYGLSTADLSGMPIDVVVFNAPSDYYYAFSGMGNGKEWRVINGNDKQSVHFCDIGGWHELVGGTSVNCVYVNPEWLNPVPNKNDIARGVFWTGEKDLNW